MEADPPRPRRARAVRGAGGSGGHPATVCHAIYFINLASADDEIYLKSVEALTATVRIAATIGADVCFHVGSHRGLGLEATMPRILAGLEAALSELGDDRWLLLENSAGAGDTIGRDVGELAAVIQAAGHERLGLCLDTCHIYVSGVDLREPAAVDALLEEIDGAVGLRAAAGAARQRRRGAARLEPRPAREHAATASSAGSSSVVLSHPALQGLPAILETAGAEGRGPDKLEMRRLRQLHRAGVRARATA